MKLLTTLALASTLTSAFAAQEFGGMKFHSSVPQDQIYSLKNDLRYLYKHATTKSDSEFSKVSELKVVDGPNMHNWLVNRFKYIVGESFELSDSSVLVKAGYKFPSTPLPAGFEAVQEVKTVMTNIGGALYLMGKRENVLLGINFDGEKIFATSPRTGLLQVGEGLFLKDFQVAPNANAPANSISRLGTLFHEARHSDGNGRSTGFTHDICPELHPYQGHAACEKSANGSYTIGALSQRQLIQNCTSCTQQEKSALTAKVADSFHRIINYDSRKEDITYYIVNFKELKATYEKMLPTASEENKKAIQAELVKINEALTILAQMDAKLESTKGVKPSILNAAPEGIWTPVSLSTSRAQMERSLKK